MRSHYLHQLGELENLLGKMGGLIVNGFADAKNAVLTGSAASVRDAVSAEKRTDVKTDEIERLCSLLLLTQQPVASDMRFIVGVMNIVVDMERIGDQLRDISETAEKCRADRDLPEIVTMLGDCEYMIRGALDSFIGRDVGLAQEVMTRDDSVDAAFAALKARLTAHAKEGRDTDALLDLLMIGKYLERIGDHATNIAEWTAYVAGGKRSHF